MEIFIKHEPHVFARGFILLFAIVISNTVRSDKNLGASEMTHSTKGITQTESNKIEYIIGTSSLSSISSPAITQRKAKERKRSIKHFDEDDTDSNLFGKSMNSRIDYNEPITFRKCCGADENFDPRLRCTKTKKLRMRLRKKGERQAVHDRIGQKYPWFPSYLISAVSPIEPIAPNKMKLERIKVDYASKPNCSESECLILQWYKEDAAFFFILISNGTIVELDNRNMQTVASWPVDSYCLESVPSDYSYHVAILCPCIHLVCVRKCCPRGFYYNSTDNICSRFSGPSREEYVPQFYSGLNKTEEKVHYYLLRKMPPCAGKKLETLNASQRAKTSLYIQKDGSIELLNLEWKNINNSRYCADIFADGINNETTNILYCIHNAEPFVIQSVSEGGGLKGSRNNTSVLVSSNTYFNLFLLVIISKNIF